ncbi:hypothetical protein PGTUg99_023645 [Puccinia graminis f. sp. tritici]|uniref:Uncharacterized protein n=1 Tax=Puccinia graminis f. sp. tritici TaxID=56615 RepID=A0A5B0RZZ8_PUCGR|nr:hypothetical protein PGTUg99_023645 [Puccinia graminis f. sp. tritici]
MKCPILFTSVLSCFLLVSLLPVQSMQFISKTATISDGKGIGSVAATADAAKARDINDVKDLREPLLPSQHPQNPHYDQHPEDEIFHNSHSDRPLPPLHSKYNPFRKMKFTGLKRFFGKYFKLPNFLNKFFKFMTKGFVTVERPFGKSVEQMDYLTQIPTDSQILARVSPAFAEVPYLADQPQFIIDARNELEQLKGGHAIYEKDQKERQMLLVKSLLMLSRKPELKEEALAAMETVMSTLKRWENADPEKLAPPAPPRLTPYIKAAHYVMTHEGSDLAQRLLKTTEGGGGHLEAHLKRQTMESWLKIFKEYKSKDVHQLYEAMAAKEVSEAEASKKLVEWSAQVIKPRPSHVQDMDDVVFALETLYVHSLHKPEGLGARNPALEHLLAARHEWRNQLAEDRAVPAAIDVTTHLAAQEASKLHSAELEEEEIAK